MSDRLQLRADLSWRTVGDEIVVLDLRTTSYFAVKGAATVLWEPLAAGTTMAGLVDVVLSEFDVDEDRARADVDTFVGEIGSRGLLR